MSELLLYPYTDNYKWIFSEKVKFKGVDSVSAILPDTWENNAEEKLVEKEDKFGEKLKSCTCLWITESELTLDFSEYILPKIKSAVALGKQIFYSRSMDQEQESMLNSTIPMNQRIEKSNFKYEKQLKKEIYDIDTPVVYVAGLSEEVNSVRQLVELKEAFEKRGYRIAIFSEAKEIEIFKDGYWLWMMSNEYKTEVSQVDKIFLANQYVKKIELEAQYDLLLIGVMKGTVVWNRKIVEDFGMNAYSISRAVKSDSILLNIFWGSYNAEALQNIGKEVSKIIGDDVDFYNISNKIISYEESEINHKICTLTVDKNLAMQKVIDLENENVYCLLDTIELERLVDDIIVKLSEYAEITRM